MFIYCDLQYDKFIKLFICAIIYLSYHIGNKLAKFLTASDLKFICKILFQFKIFLQYTLQWGGPRWRSWLRHCATSQKVAGSIPDGVIGISH